MNKKPFQYVAILMNILQKVLGTRFNIHGLEKLPNQPIMFVSNHFTRSETFFIPYILYKHTNRQVRCLADSKIFVGKFGSFLESLGTLSTKDPNRDKTIIHDLITKNCDWMIYPEGSMIKSKEIKNDGIFISNTPYRIGPVRTGSAVLALKSELFRRNIIDAFINKDNDLLEEYQKDYQVEYNKNLNNLTTYVVPLNITYYPLRPGDNKIKKIISRFVKKIPEQILEELEIEGNILLGSNIDINFGDPISLSEYLNPTREAINKIPIIKYETKNNLILRYLKYRLTNHFMEKIYCHSLINLDHIFASSLYHVTKNRISINHLKRIVYYSAILIGKLKKYRIDDSILEKNLFKIFIDEPNSGFDSVFELSKTQQLIFQLNNSEIEINKINFQKKYDFHHVRIENTLKVIANEFFLLESANSIVKRICKMDDSELRSIVFNEIYKNDIEEYNNDYQEFYDKNLSKNKLIGSPQFKNNNEGENKEISILLTHGYKSSPKEIEKLAKFLNEKNFKTYSVRLKGHGTSPENLKHIKWQDWYDSVQRGYAALQNISNKIILIGFSTGGLLSLLSCAKKNHSSNKIFAVVSINSALKLLDIRSIMVPGINLWNEILEKFDIEKGKYDSIEDKPENPETNYNKHYISSVYELEKLMKECSENLKQINIPAFIIQSTKDPVVNPLSGDLIYEKIISKKKILYKPNLNNHVIINSENTEELFNNIYSFILNTKNS